MAKQSPLAHVLKQQLADLGHKLSADVGSWLVLLEEGASDQATTAKQHAKSDLLKYGADMKALASQMGSNYAQAAQGYLECVDVMVHTSSGLVDEAQINSYYKSLQTFEALLS